MRQGMVAFSATVAAGLFAFAGYAYAFGGHAFQHHGSAAIGPCIVVMSQQQRSSLKGTFSGQRQTLMTDRQNVVSARKALSAAILSGGKSLSSEESTLASAQEQLQKDRDALAVQVCGQLNSTQLSAAQTLFNTLTTLHENSRQQARSYFQAAQAAGGASSGQGSNDQQQ